MHHRSLDIEVRPDGARVTLVLVGELDMASAGILKACLESIDAGFRHVVLDLTGLTFLDSTGLGLIAETVRRFQPEMRELALHNPSGHVAKVIDLTGLATVVPVTGVAAPTAVAPAAASL
jgi:anti-sigma B factor antagonist